MRVILARHRVAGEQAPPAVHAFRVPDNPMSATVWHSVCGVQLTPIEAEVVPQHTGAPCSVCLLAALAEDGATAPTTRDQRTRIGTRPTMQPVSPRGSYAVALAGERQTHLVSSHAPRSALDGENVVQALCGHLGWGPMATPPEGWPVCSECSDAADGWT